MRNAQSAPLPIQSVSRAETLSRQAYQSIRTSIRSGAISPNGFYSEVQLAQALKISRTPVREALIELEREGLVEIVPQRGFRLRSISDDERREAFELRDLIETHVVRRLAKEATDSDVAELRRIVDHQAKVISEPAQFIEADEAFHLAIPTLLGLERTRRILLTLRGIIWLAGLDAISIPERSVEVLAEHRAVVAAVAAHDQSSAAKAMKSHIDQTRRALTERNGRPS
jgi:DNA-binding GntR family transcriptional regulator